MNLFRIEYDGGEVYLVVAEDQADARAVLRDELGFDPEDLVGIELTEFGEADVVELVDYDEFGETKATTTAAKIIREYGRGIAAATEGP